jgi:hypothetical protein
MPEAFPPRRNIPISIKPPTHAPINPIGLLEVELAGAAAGVVATPPDDRRAGNADAICVSVPSTCDKSGGLIDEVAGASGVLDGVSKTGDGMITAGAAGSTTGAAGSTTGAAGPTTGAAGDTGFPRDRRGFLIGELIKVC